MRAIVTARLRLEGSPPSIFWEMYHPDYPTVGYERSEGVLWKTDMLAVAIRYAREYIAEGDWEVESVEPMDNDAFLIVLSSGR